MKAGERDRNRPTGFSPSYPSGCISNTLRVPVFGKERFPEQAILLDLYFQFGAGATFVIRYRGQSAFIERGDSLLAQMSAITI
jgi:hypothetical protein